VNPSGSVSTGLWRATAALAAFATLVGIALAITQLDPSALCALPALVLPALLALRRYPGERNLAVRLYATRRARRRRRRRRVSLARAPEVAVPRGGLLLAWSLAVRPPPPVRLAAG
jgi:hypothetical protein